MQFSWLHLTHADIASQLTASYSRGSSFTSTSRKSSGHPGESNSSTAINKLTSVDCVQHKMLNTECSNNSRIAREDWQGLPEDWWQRIAKGLNFHQKCYYGRKGAFLTHLCSPLKMSTWWKNQCLLSVSKCYSSLTLNWKMEKVLVLKNAHYSTSGLEAIYKLKI